MRTNLHHLLEDAAGQRRTAAALTYKDTTVDYQSLWRQARAVAAGLRRLGLCREDRVAIFLDKRIETVTSIFGVSAASGVFVPLNPLLRPAQVQYVLDDCSVRVLVTSRDRFDVLADRLKGCASLEHVVLVDDARTGHRPDANGTGFEVHRWSQVCEEGEAPPAPEPVIDLDIAAVLYTSGSTGKPKGVVLSHRNLIAGAESVSSYLGNNRDDVILAALPLSFDAGLSQLTTAFCVGAHVVLLNYLLPKDLVRLCAKHAVTGLTCVPPLWIQLADEVWPREAARAIRYFANTGGKMPRATLDKLRAQLPDARPFLMYGLTEAFRSTYLDPLEVDRRPDSIGRAVPNAEILVLRPDGSACGPGEEGELVHRGALVALGYWGDTERTAQRFRPVSGAGTGWRTPEPAVWSGDMVVADEEGFLYFVGRKDDMIKTSGYRVSPTEIEEVAYDTGLVRDAVALGLDDARLGQRVALVVTPTETATFDAELLVAAMRRELPLYMVPTEVHARAEIPRSPNGKFDRALLRTELSS